jgi:hypothetical protein
MKTGTLQEWQELGNLTKQAYNLLSEILIKASHIMPNYLLDNNIRMSLKYLTYFCCSADSRAFKNLKLQISTNEIAELFYGRIKEDENPV